MTDNHSPLYPPLYPSQYPSAEMAARRSRRAPAARRWWTSAVAWAATTAAAVALAGCAANDAALSPPVVVRQQRVAADQVREYTTNIDAALDQVDRDRLRAAEKKAAAAAAIVATTTAPATVVLASNGGDAATQPAAAAAETALVANHQASTPAAMGKMMAMATPTPDVLSGGPIGSVTSIEGKEPTVDEALAVLRKNVAAHPTLNTALALALLDSGDPKSSELSKELSESDRRVYGDLLGALQGMGAAPGKGNEPLAERTAPLAEAAKKWQQDADLALPKLVLASRVDSFGVYSAVEPKFEQGKAHTVIIYCEVANFVSLKDKDGWYDTKLSQQETLITEDGLLVWRPNAEEVEDRSMNQRRDFYLVKKLTIPETLAAGKYTLRMSVTDRNANKLSMVALPIEIVVK